MSKILAALIAGLFAAGAFAQAGPKSSETQVQTDSKPQQKAQMKRDAKPAGAVKAMGDTPKAPETGAIGTDKAAMAGEKRAETRDDRRRNKDGSVKQKSMQGATPK
ncbi:MAG: cell envelope biogenesis protein TolA [Gammaproteobacteria bacterium]|nr:cell envelope biogenesis protein TolA [Gammaproteobacteria bacterium]MBU1442938.1 cell envelope biogenesis protein TolA [Gammaproteobacteria bacterium]MBU2285105.1 cell envelope biogenesis protein TolA [Gammaproteobacteria bacterium]MBU2409865.1 cell envelope biogenesis protein TolA [Gammaproteobacteria bacterium]